jgi:alpha-mannosidase
VECDTNIPCGESLVRQILYGKEFFRAEFGKDMRICWLPDVFGYSANLPQILRKTGLEYFMTIKLSWNEHNEFPHKTFVWEGIDGSGVLVHMAPEGDYNSGGTPLCVKRAAEQFTEKDRLDEALLIFGAGDGGGGPGEAHIELIKRQEDVEGFPKVRFGTAIDFFNRLRTKKEVLATHRGELYLEKHQGTYTTQGRSKRNNRKIEFMLHDLEFVATAAFLKGIPYPAEFIEKTWKETLLYQFHDIIPGSSITRVYKESRDRYASMMEQIRKETDRLLRLLSADSEEGLSFANTSSFPRSQYMKAGDSWYMGSAGPFSIGKLERVEEIDGLGYTGDTIENKKLIVKFSPKGEIVSLISRESGKEYCGAYLNRLVLYTDKWTDFNAWDIDIDYAKKHKVLLTPVRHETFVDGPRVVRRNHYTHAGTHVVQEISLMAGGDLVEFDTSCDFHEIFRMLRADFAPAVYSDNVKCDIQFGSFERSTRDDTSIEKAQFEICAHKWVDVSDGERGFALLNDCKYGHRVKNGLISLNLLRSPIYPDPKADRGEHHFKYALYPHEGGAFASDLIRLGYHFNMEPPVFRGEALLSPLFETDSGNIVIETVKKAEKRNGIVLRAYEACGIPTEAGIRTSIAYQACFLTDMLEAPLGETSLQRLVFEPFETKTILLEL